MPVPFAPPVVVFIHRNTTGDGTDNGCDSDCVTTLACVFGSLGFIIICLFVIPFLRGCYLRQTRESVFLEP